MQETDRTPRRPQRVAVLADSDTRWKWGVLTARRLVEPAARVDGYLLRGRATPTPRQLDEAGVRADSLREVSAVEFLHTVGTSARDGDRYDVVVLALVGGGVQALLHGLGHAFGAGGPAARRPAVVTGYVGVVYEKLADGLLLRHGADLVVANSRYDARRFRAVYEGVGADASAVVEAALPFLAGDAYDPAARAGRGPYTVTFAVQPSVPESRRDRAYLLRRAVGHARLHPEREVLVKLRSRPGEHTTHIEEAPYQKLVGTLGPLPANCRLVYGHMGEVLDRTDLLVTVSSTAALESLHRGVPTAVLTDLGVREALGNHHFLGSGCLTSWDRLDAGEVPEPDPDWVAEQGVRTAGAYDAARKRLTELTDPATELPPLDPYYTATTAPGYLPGVLARHHLGRDGAPLPGAPAATAEPGRLRRALRHTARGAYRHGVQRVAPVIRRIGEL
ncbi:DUF6716 putative glycosyltransferase [Streptomyces sp. NPDC060194]|uniref:DUF6716 putative glycosyltransferase n=1 Tax=Streptomyces sp. NPDC060194 TaxID=3347069 RepID=UPI00366A2B27